MFRRDQLPRPNQPIRYAQQRDLVRSTQAARNVQPGGGLTLDVTGQGAYLSQKPSPVMGLFEIRDSDCDWRWEERSSSGWPYQWHYTVGRPIFYYLSDGTWAVPSVNEGSDSSGIIDEYIVHPTGYPELIAEDQRLHDAFWPLYSDGDWVWCIYDPGSMHWAIHDGYESWLRFELAEHLPVGGSALAYLVQCTECPPEDSSSSSGTCGTASIEDCQDIYVANTDFTFRVYDGLCGWEGHKGQRGYCKFFAESRRFEVVVLRRAMVAVELAEDLDQWETEPVDFYRRCWDPSANSGYGAFITDCDQTIKGKDGLQVGYFGYVSEGPTGIVEMFHADNGPVGVLRDLRCPIECICGEQGPDAHCDSSGA